MEGWLDNSTTDWDPLRKTTNGLYWENRQKECQPLVLIIICLLLMAAIVFQGLNNVWSLNHLATFYLLLSQFLPTIDDNGPLRLLADVGWWPNLGSSTTYWTQKLTISFAGKIDKKNTSRSFWWSIIYYWYNSAGRWKVAIVFGGAVQCLIP